MHATSSDQYDAAVAFAVPDLEQVRSDVWALGQPMPGDHLPASLLYLLRDSAGGVHVVDPGTDSAANLDRLVAALTRIDASLDDVRSLTVTHLHPDHLGMATRIQSQSPASLRLHRAEAAALSDLDAHRPTAAGYSDLADEWRVPASHRAELTDLVTESPAGDTAASLAAAPRVDELLDDGDRLDIPGFGLRVMHTPGHTPGSICLVDSSRGIVFTGDTLLPTVFAGLGLGGPTASNPLADYLAGLARLEELPADIEVLPGHGYRFTDLRSRAADSAEHHLVRAREVAAVVAAAPETPVWDIAARLTWTAGFANLSGFQLFSALSQTAMLRGYVQSSQKPGGRTPVD